MQLQDLANNYRDKTDEELLQLYANSDQLTLEAFTVLRGELSRRRIVPTSISPQNEVIAEPQSLPTEQIPERTVKVFIEEVVRTYRNHFWVFVQLTAPAVIGTYFLWMVSRTEVREIAKHIPRGSSLVSHKLEILEISFINVATYVATWLVFSLSYAAISSAVDQVSRGSPASPAESYSQIRDRVGSFFRVSLLLFVIYAACFIAGILLTSGLYWVVLAKYIHAGRFMNEVVVPTLVAFAITLLLSRLALAVPAVVLDNYKVGKAIFRSDDLTEGKWLVLAALLAKSTIMGYVAGMLPFWIRFWVWNYVQLPDWLTSAASITGVTLVEPTLFIGLALLYVQTSALTPASLPTSSSNAAPGRSPLPFGTN